MESGDCLGDAGGPRAFAAPTGCARGAAQTQSDARISVRDVTAPSACGEATARRWRALVRKRCSNPGNDGRGQRAPAASRSSAYRSANPPAASGRRRNRPRPEQKIAPTARSKRMALSTPGCGANHHSPFLRLGCRLVSVKRPAANRTQPDRREGVTGANAHPGCELQKQNSHRLLKNIEFLSASLAPPFIPTGSPDPILPISYVECEGKALPRGSGSESVLNVARSSRR